MRGFIGPLGTLALLALTGCASSPQDVATGTAAPAASADGAVNAGGETPVSDAAVSDVAVADSPTLPAFYTADQAVRGEGFFRETCLSCHESSEFRGSTFEREWRGRTVRNLYAAIAYSMPDDNPGGLPAQTYTDIIAYILEINGYPPGSSELTPDRTAMRALALWPEAQVGR